MNKLKTKWTKAGYFGARAIWWCPDLKLVVRWSEVRRLWVINHADDKGQPVGDAIAVAIADCYTLPAAKRRAEEIGGVA